MAIKTKEQAEQQTLTATVAPIDDFDFDSSDYQEFADNLVESTSIPYAQMIRLPNMAVSMIEKAGLPWGIFVTLDQAEKVNFKPDANWTAQDVTFESNGKEEIVSGYISHRLHLSVIRFADVEIQEKTATGWQFLDVMFRDGKQTEAAAKVEHDKENHRRANRSLVLFLGDDNQPLHDAPLQLNFNGAFGASFGSELKEFYKETANVFAKKAAQAGVKIKGSYFDDKTKALALFDGEIAWVKPDSDKAPSFFVKARKAPAIDQVGVVKTVTRKTKKGKETEVTLTGVPLGQVLLKKSSELAQTIHRYFDEHESFSLPNAGRNGEESGKATPPTTVSGIATGFWDGTNDQRYTVLLKTDRGEFNLYADQPISQALANQLDNYEELKGSFTCQKEGDWLRILSFNLSDPMEASGEEF